MQAVSKDFTQEMPLVYKKAEALAEQVRLEVKGLEDRLGDFNDNVRAGVMDCLNFELVPKLDSMTQAAVAKTCAHAEARIADLEIHKEGVISDLKKLESFGEGVQSDLKKLGVTADNVTGDLQALGVGLESLRGEGQQVAQQLLAAGGGSATCPCTTGNCPCKCNNPEA